MVVDGIIRGEDVLYNFSLYRDKILDQDENGHKETIIRIACTLNLHDQVTQKLLENLYLYFTELSPYLRSFFWLELVNYDLRNNINANISNNISKLIANDMVRQILEKN